MPTVYLISFAFLLIFSVSGAFYQSTVYRKRKQPPTTGRFIRRGVAVTPSALEPFLSVVGSDENGDSATVHPRYRAAEITQILFGQFLRPVFAALVSEGIPKDWNSFWSQTNGGSLTHAQRLASAVEELGPVYVKFGQALGSRQDIIPKSLADALCILQDGMEPFDSETAKDIIRSELLDKHSSLAFFDNNPDNLEDFLETLSKEPIAAASVGQVFSGTLPRYGKVAVKVQRPNIREIVERDAELLRSVASWIEHIPAIQLSGTDESSATKNRLINTELETSVNEFMSRIFEELDYQNEANNMDKFASLYSLRRGSSKNVKVVVPEVLLDLCTDNVIVMEFIEGTKLTNVVNEGDTSSNEPDTKVVAENLALVELCIDSTLSQLLDTGVLHADPHGGNLLKVKMPKVDGIDPFVRKPSRRRRLANLLHRKSQQSPQLGYLDFGMLSSVDQSVRDALVCSTVLLVFAKDVEGVANLFGELQLLPKDVISDPQEMAALENALDRLFENVLTYPDQDDGANGASDTQIPSLRFDKLLDSLTRLIPRFRFDLPPYFINNARALSTLEGIARSLDPSFSVLQVVYPYALNRLLRNPSGSDVVDNTLQQLIRSEETGLIDRSKVTKMLTDAALITGYRKRKVLADILRTEGGRRLARAVVLEKITGQVFPPRLRKRSF